MPRAKAWARSVFRKESYGIQFPKDSPLRKPVNEALLRMDQDGTYDRLQTKWFGREATTHPSR